MQRNLRRLAHRADEQADAGTVMAPVGSPDIVGHSPPGSSPSRNLTVIQGAGIGGDQTDAENEAEVADPVDQEGLHVGEMAVGLLYQKPISR